MLQFFNILWQPFIFSNHTEIDHFMLDLLKSFNSGPSENFLIVDHLKKDQEFKYFIIGGILDQLWKSPLKQEKDLISGPQLNIASIIDLLKTFSEIIVAIQIWSTTRIEKQAVS